MRQVDGPPQTAEQGRKETVQDCVVCHSTPENRLRPWLFQCRRCGTWVSALKPYDQESDGAGLDEERRLKALRRLRQQNFTKILDCLEEVTELRGLSLLEVGCGHGWFLEAANQRGMNTTGIEPDAGVASRARSIGVQVIEGFFPENLVSASFRGCFLPRPGL